MVRLSFLGYFGDKSAEELDGFSVYISNWCVNVNIDVIDNMKKKTIKQPFKIDYFYQEPKNEQEAKVQQSKINRAFDILFEVTLAKMKADNKL